MRTVALCLILIFGLQALASLKAIELDQANVFSVLAFPKSQTALVGVVSDLTGHAAFATCSVKGSQLEECDFESTEQFAFSDTSMIQLRDLFFKNLTQLSAAPVPIETRQSYSKLFHTNFNFLSFVAHGASSNEPGEDIIHQALRHAIRELNF